MCFLLHTHAHSGVVNNWVSLWLVAVLIRRLASVAAKGASLLPWKLLTERSGRYRDGGGGTPAGTGGLRTWERHRHTKGRCLSVSATLFLAMLCFLSLTPPLYFLHRSLPRLKVSIITKMNKDTLSERMRGRVKSEGILKSQVCDVCEHFSFSCTGES